MDGSGLVRGELQRLFPQWRPLSTMGSPCIGPIHVLPAEGTMELLLPSRARRRAGSPAIPD